MWDTVLLIESVGSHLCVMCTSTFIFYFDKVLQSDALFLA